MKRALSRRPAASRLRTRVAIVAAGVGASAALGAGVSAAADGGPAVHDAPAEPAASTQLVPVSYQASDAHHDSHDKGGDDTHHKGGNDSHDHAGRGADKGHGKGDHRGGGRHGDHHKNAHHGKKLTWVRPVHHYKLTASFDQAGGLWSHKHSGQDFAVPVGTPVGAAHSGVVVKAGPNGGGDGPAYGNAIVIYNGYGTYSQYAHLSQIDVHVGEKVKAGEHIALSGDTGNTTGPHLHFEIRHTPNYGSAVNPVTFLSHHGLKV
ncbi:M23 family metallopeptidase [Streptomyces sp. TS71-3]|uniref:M23 family metallopeptidase n=1 Tax=Streptomyces sp. TS71-3 TaxID=2733862 RepID=UPI0035AC22F5